MLLYIINKTNLCVLKKDFQINRDFIKKNAEFFSLVVSNLIVYPDEFPIKLYNNRKLITWVSEMMKSSIAQFNKLSPETKFDAFIASRLFEDDQAERLRQILTLLETCILDYFLPYDYKIEGKLEDHETQFLYCNFELQEEADLFIGVNRLRLI